MLERSLTAIKFADKRKAAANSYKRTIRKVSTSLTYWVFYTETICLFTHFGMLCGNFLSNDIWAASYLGGDSTLCLSASSGFL